jgi:hypothetical protein
MDKEISRTLENLSAAALCYSAALKTEYGTKKRNGIETDKCLEKLKLAAVEYHKYLILKFIAM